jgi:hypothetical protein
MPISIRDELAELSKQVIQLQFQLSLAFLELKRRPLQERQPINDNLAAGKVSGRLPGEA